jgi:cardiolipin synthase A/B
MLDNLWNGSIPWAVYVPVALTVGSWLIYLTMLYVVPHNRDPESALGWLLFSFLLPYLAVVVFAFIGSPKLPDTRRKKQRQVNDFLERWVKEAQDDANRATLFPRELKPHLEPITRLVERLGEMPVVDGNAVELLGDYQGSIKRIAADIDHAERYVHLLYFIFADDDMGRLVIDALCRAAKRGVTCRVLYDTMGSWWYSRRVAKELEAAGIDVCPTLPLKLFGAERLRPDLRNHRKIVVVDGMIGYAGSQNLVKQEYKPGVIYEELVARVRGPVVGQLNAVFLSDLFSETDQRAPTEETPNATQVPEAQGDVPCQVLPSGPAFDTDNIALLFATLLYAAKKRAVLITPYFIPDASLLRAIENAALRGIDVHLIVSEQGDQFLVSRAQRSYYEEMLRAGIKIHAVRAPTFIHAKHLSIDDDICVVGSSNFDVRSFQLNLEIVLLAYSADVVRKQRAIERSYIERSTPIDLDEWLQRPRTQQFVENTCRLLSALL